MIKPSIHCCATCGNVPTVMTHEGIIWCKPCHVSVMDKDDYDRLVLTWNTVQHTRRVELGWGATHGTE